MPLSHYESLEDQLDAWNRLLEQCEHNGLASAEGLVWRIHPLLPYAFRELRAAASAESLHTELRDFVSGVAAGAVLVHNSYSQGDRAAARLALQARPSLQTALRHALSQEMWKECVMLLQGMWLAIHESSGDQPKWRSLIEHVLPHFVDTSTLEMRSGREEQAALVLEMFSISLQEMGESRQALPIARAVLEHHRARCGSSLMQPFETLSPSQKRNLRWLVEALQNFGNALFHTKDGESISILEEAAAIALSLKDDPALASINLNLGNAYLSVVEPPDFTNAEMYFRRSLAKRPEPDVLGRGRCATALGGLYFSRWLEQPWPDLDQDGADQALLQKFMDDATADLRQSDAYFELAIELLPAIPSGDLCACYYNSAQVKIKLHVMGLWRNRQSSYIESAMERFTIAGRMAGDLGNRLQAAQFRLQTAKMALQTGRISLAREFAKAALVTYQSLEEDSTREQLETYKLLVEIAHSEKSSS